MTNSKNKPDEEQFYQTYDWMRDIYLRKSNGKVVPISGRLLDIFAIIYGFSKSGDSCYYGSLQTIARRLRTSTARVSADVKTLVSYGLIRKGAMQREVGWSTTYATKIYSHNVKRTDDINKVTVFDKNNSITKEDDTVIFHNSKNSKNAKCSYQNDKSSYHGDKQGVIKVINHINRDIEYINLKTPKNCKETVEHPDSNIPQQAVLTPKKEQSPTSQLLDTSDTHNENVSPVSKTEEKKERKPSQREKEVSKSDIEMVTAAYEEFYSKSKSPRCELTDSVISACKYAVSKFGNKIEEIISNINSSSFLQKANDLFTPDFKWVFAVAKKNAEWNCEKILNGKYKDRKDKGPAFKDGHRDHKVWKK